MTIKDFDRAKELQGQIDALDKFVKDCMEPVGCLWFARCREARTLPITVARGTQEIIVNAVDASDRLSTRIMIAVMEELEDLHREFESLGTDQEV